MIRVNKQALMAKSAFQDAVERTPDIVNAYRKGLQALKNTESGKVVAAIPSQIDGSVDIDSAVKHLYPEDNRWDYAVSYAGKVCYVEVHPAYTSEVSKMEAKLAWLKKWLKDKAPLLGALPEYTPAYVWVQTKGAYILPQSSQAKRLSKLGVKMVSVLKLS